jgi:hypothetical protein
LKTSILEVMVAPSWIVFIHREDKDSIVLLPWLVLVDHRREAVTLALTIGSPDELTWLQLQCLGGLLMLSAHERRWY